MIKVTGEKIMSQMTEDYELELGRVRQPKAHPTSGIEIQITGVQDSEAERFKTLAAEVSFAVSSSKAGKLAAARTPVWIYVHTADLARKTVTYVASAQVELEPEVFTYTKRLEFPIPQVGRYELHTLVVALPPMPAMTCHRGPSFPVRP